MTQYKVVILIATVSNVLSYFWIKFFSEENQFQDSNQNSKKALPDIPMYQSPICTMFMHIMVSICHWNAFDELAFYILHSAFTVQFIFKNC